MCCTKGLLLNNFGMARPRDVMEYIFNCQSIKCENIPKSSAIKCSLMSNLVNLK